MGAECWVLLGAGSWILDAATGLSLRIQCCFRQTLRYVVTETASIFNPVDAATDRLRPRLRSAQPRAQPGTWSSSLHDLFAGLAFLDGTASTGCFGSTLLGCSHSPTSAFLHCHHSFFGASNRTVAESQLTAICRNAFSSGCIWLLAPGIARKSGDHKKYTGNLCARVLANPHR